ncbi:MAG: hypothetical protein RLZ10_686 [Bacteroidota bacterium]|jgi:hypothetical protein
MKKDQKSFKFLIKINYNIKYQYTYINSILRTCQMRDVPQ